MSDDVILVIVVRDRAGVRLHQWLPRHANVVATSISTRAIGPRRAVAIASVLNFVGAFISLKVAETVGQGFVDTAPSPPPSSIAGLLGAIAWNIMTWYVGLPSSSSHALIGGLVGSVIAARGGAPSTETGSSTKLVVPAVVSPLVAFAAAWLAVTLVYRIVRACDPAASAAASSSGQVVSGGLLALRTAPTTHRRPWA